MVKSQTLTNIKWIRGTLPPGTEITTDGKMVVTDQDALKAVAYDLQLVIIQNRFMHQFFVPGV